MQLSKKKIEIQAARAKRKNLVMLQVRSVSTEGGVETVVNVKSVVQVQTKTKLPLKFSSIVTKVPMESVYSDQFSCIWGFQPTRYH